MSVVAVKYPDGRVFIDRQKLRSAMGYGITHRTVPCGPSSQDGAKTVAP